MSLSSKCEAKILLYKKIYNNVHNVGNDTLSGKKTCDY